MGNKEAQQRSRESVRKKIKYQASCQSVTKRLLVTALLCVVLLGGCGKTQGEAGQDASQEGSRVQDTSTEDSRKNAEGNLGELERLRVPLPEDFKASTTTGLYLSADYPDDMSNVYLYTAQKDPSFSETMQNGQQTFVDNLAQSYQTQYEEMPQITVLRYEPVIVGNYNAYVIELTYTLQNTAYYQLEYIIDAEQTYFAAFSQVGNLSWAEIFYECAAGMYFVTEQ